MSSGRTTFGVVAIRRSQQGSAPVTWAEVSRQVIDLVAQAPTSCRVQVDLRADPTSGLARLDWTVVGDTGEVGLTRELQELLEARFRTVEHQTDVVEEDATGQVLRLDLEAALPRRRAAGLLARQEDVGGWVLSLPTSVDATDLVSSIVASPGLIYRVEIAPTREDDMVAQSRRLEEHRPEVTQTLFDTLRMMGTPVAITASLRASRGPVSLRARAAVNDWFDDIELRPGDESDELVPLPAGLAAALLRLPTFDDGSWRGFPLEASRTVPVVLSSDPREDSVVRLGHAQNPVGARLDVGLSENDLLRHVHVIGQTGTGKSSLLAGIVHEATAKGWGVLVLDPHSTLVDRIAEELTPEAAERAWLVRMGDPGNPVRLNTLTVETAQQRDAAILDIADIFSAIFDPQHQGIVGPRFEQALVSTLRSLAELHGDRATLTDVPRILSDSGVARRLASSEDPDLRAFWSAWSSNRSSEHQEVLLWITSKFSRFLSSQQMREVLATGTDSIDPVAAMDESRVVLIDLDRGGLGAVASRMLGLLFVNHFWTAAFQRRTSRPFLVVVDEAHSFSATALPAMAAEGRKFGIGLVAAHQHPDQLDAELEEGLDGNAATTVLFRAGPAAAHALAPTVAPEFDEDDLRGLPDLRAAMVSTRHDLHRDPFTLFVDYNERAHRSPDQRARIEAQTIRDLVEPLRAAVPLSTDDVVAPSAVKIPAPSESVPDWQEELLRQADGGPLVGQTGRSFLDEWLEKRKQRAAEPSAGAGQNVAVDELTSAPSSPDGEEESSDIE